MKVNADYRLEISPWNHLDLRRCPQSGWIFYETTDDESKCVESGPKVLPPHLLELAVEDYQWKDAQIFSPRPQPASGGRGDYTVNPDQKLLRLDFIVPPRLCHLGENQINIRIAERVPYEYGATIILEKVEVHLDYLSP